MFISRRGDLRSSAPAENVDKVKNFDIAKNICETIVLEMTELLAVKIDVKIFASSIVGSFVVSLAIELLAVKVDAKIFVVANLADRSRLALTLIAKSFTTADDELDSCKRPNK